MHVCGCGCVHVNAWVLVYQVKDSFAKNFMEILHCSCKNHMTPAAFRVLQKTSPVHAAEHCSMELKASNVKWGAGTAQLVEHPTEKPGMILMQVQVSGAARDFSPRVNISTSSADSLMVSVQSPCAIACLNMRVHVKTPKHWQPYHCLHTWKYYTHCQEWVALFLRLLCLTHVR